LAAKTAHMWVVVDRLAYPLHHPMACGRKMRGQGLLPGVVLSHHCSGGDASPGDVKLPGLNIWWSVDHPGTCGPILSCQAFNVAASQGPNSDGAYLVLEAPGCDCQEPGCVSSWVTRMGHNRSPSLPWVQYLDKYSLHQMVMCGNQPFEIDSVVVVGAARVAITLAAPCVHHLIG
jgi:hypothetical protein